LVEVRTDLMNKFSYQAVNQKAEKINGVLNAETLREATRVLESKQLQIIKLGTFKATKTSHLKHGKLKPDF